MSPSRTFVTKLLAATAGGCFAVAAHAITIDYYTIDSIYTGDYTYNFGSSVPPASQLVDKTVGSNYARTQFDYLGSGDQVTMLTKVDHKRAGPQGAYAETFFMMDFTATAAVSYGFSGGYDVTDFGDPSQVYFNFYLYDLTTSSTVVQNYQVSFSSANESYVAGGNGGDAGYLLLGSLSGTLTAGHEYQYYYQSYIQADAANDGASASGTMRLDIGGGAVPDSGATALMLGAALAGCLAIRRRK